MKDKLDRVATMLSRFDERSYQVREAQTTYKVDFDPDSDPDSDP